MANCGSGLPAEWPFRSQNAIEASDSPLPGGLWVKRLITHALCSLAYYYLPKLPFWQVCWLVMFVTCQNLILASMFVGRVCLFVCLFVCTEISQNLKNGSVNHHQTSLQASTSP